MCGPHSPETVGCPLHAGPAPGPGQTGPGLWHPARPAESCTPDGLGRTRACSPDVPVRPRWEGTNCGWTKRTLRLLGLV